MASSPAATATRILDAAQRLVQTRGFDGFSYADIASELRIRKASIHYHFPTKNELGRRLLARYREGFLAVLADIERVERTAARRLRRYAAVWRRVLVEDDRMCLCGMMASSSATLPAALRREIRLFFDENEAWLARVLEAGRKMRELDLLDSPLVEARVLTVGLEGAMLVARSYGEPRRFEEIAARLLSGLGLR
jgi:TetR/AcrR family transcriptional repressor of nem operon